MLYFPKEEFFSETKFGRFSGFFVKSPIANLIPLAHPPFFKPEPRDYIVF